MTAKCLGLETGEEYGHWAGVQMRNAYDLGWLTEEDCAWSQFNDPVHRQLAAKILAVALDLELTDEIPYSDYADVGQDYVPYVGRCARPGSSTALRTGQSVRASSSPAPRPPPSSTGPQARSWSG